MAHTHALMRRALVPQVAPASLTLICESNLLAGMLAATISTTTVVVGVALVELTWWWSGPGWSTQGVATACVCLCVKSVKLAAGLAHLLCV